MGSGDEPLEDPWRTLPGTALEAASATPTNAPALAALLANLTASPLLNAEQRVELQVDLKHRFRDSVSLVKELSRRGWLTSFQAQHLLENRAQGLALGPYVLLARLGEGGMGQVFKARHQVMKRVVALKVIRKGVISYAEQVDRFQREIEIVAQLSHPNIVVAHDAGRVGDVHFFAMQFLEGADLARRLNDGPLAIDKACDYAHQTALGLQHAHEHALVHRDIKPNNLLICKAEPGSTREVVKILDLGLARIQYDAGNRVRALTQIGGVMGTPDYIAPEQTIDASRVDIRADIYSLGCTLYHALAGRPPFLDSSLADKLKKHRHAEPTPIGDLREVPKGLAVVLGKMMAKRKEDRYQTPNEVAAALKPFCGEPPGNAIVATGITANAPTPAISSRVPELGGSSPATQTSDLRIPVPGPSTTIQRRRRLLMVAGGAGSAILGLFATVFVLIALLAWLFWPRPPGPREPVPPEEFTNTIGITLKLIPAGTFLMGSQDSENGRQIMEGPQHEVKISKPFYLGIHEVTVRQFRAFVEATGYRTQGETNGIHFWDMQAGAWAAPNPKLSWRNPGWPQTEDHPVVGITWEDSVRFCQWLSDTEGYRYRLPTEAEWEYACRAGRTTAYSFGDAADTLEQFAWFDKNAKGKTQQVGQLDPNPWGLYDMHGNVSEWCIDAFEEQFYKTSPRVDPVNNRRPGVDPIRVSARGGWIYKGPADARSAYRTWASSASPSTACGCRVLCEYSSKDPPFDGQFLDAMDGSQIPEKSRLDGVDRLVGVLESTSFQSGIQQIAFSPDGRYLAGGVLGDLQTRDLFGALDVDGAFSPDSRLIAVQGKKGGQLWEVFTNVPVRPLEESQSYSRAQSFSPDGKQLLSGHDDGKMRLWDVATGKLIRPRITVYDGSVRSVRFSADGRRALTSPAVSYNAKHHVFLWDTTSWTKVREFAIDVGLGGRADFAPQGHSFAFGNKNGTVHYWKMDSAEPELVELKGSHAKEVISLAFTPDGNKLVTVDLDGKFVLWDLAKKAGTLLAQAPGRVLDVKLSPDGRYFAFPCDKMPGKVYIAKMPAG